jgi:hypothetical protein
LPGVLNLLNKLFCGGFLPDTSSPPKPPQLICGNLLSGSFQNSRKIICRGWKPPQNALKTPAKWHVFFVVNAAIHVIKNYIVIAVQCGCRRCRINNITTAIADCNLKPCYLKLSWWTNDDRNLLREYQIAGFYERFCLIDKDFDDKKLQK